MHQIRTSIRFVNYKDRKQFCADMRMVYTAPNEQAGLEALDAFEQKWGHKYQYAVKSWRANWQSLATMYKYPESIRKVIHTTNPVESFNRVVRKVAKTKGSFPTDDSVLKLIYMVVVDTQDRMLKANHDWSQIVNQLVVYYGERVSRYMG